MFRVSAAILGILLVAFATLGLEPPTREQLERYRTDGSLARRIAAARAIGNHRIHPDLARQLATPSGAKAGSTSTEAAKRLPATGTNQVLALLISFADYPSSNTAATITSQLFGDGNPADLPYDSLRNFYRRSSYGQLELTGSALGWYTTAGSRDAIEQATAGREALIREALAHYDQLGTDFSRFDNDGDGSIDYFVVIWTGPRGEWGSFWWGYQTTFSDSSFVVDGKTLGSYSWQWEAQEYPGSYSPGVVIHETGHALGLPDYYDYQDLLGPRGGVGGLDQMGGRADHCAFSKFMLGWLTPRIHNQGTSSVSLTAFDLVGDVALLMHGDPPADPYAEYFLVEHRRQQGNDLTTPGEGLLIWHVDARLDERGDFRYDNSFTEHKLLRLMEADGLEEIEQLLGADEGDYYTPGSQFAPHTMPSSNRHDSAPTNLVVDNISPDGNAMRLDVSLGSGCAIYCDADVAQTSWRGATVEFDASSTTTANCNGSPSYDWTILQATADTALFSLQLGAPGSHEWSLRTELGDASCSRSDSVLVGTDDRCWPWLEAPRMGTRRAGHDAAVLPDGRVLVASSPSEPEVFDPATSTWSNTRELHAYYNSPLLQPLEDGRVLITGSAVETYYPGVNAEIYDPSTNRWEFTGAMAEGRWGAAMARLADGRVLVAGGLARDSSQNWYYTLATEIFDPQSETWSPAGNTSSGLFRPCLTALEDGRALLTGYSAAEIFDPTTNTWSQASAASPRASYPSRGAHVSVRLLDGRVLIAGGYFSPTAEIYDPVSDTFSFVEPMDSSRPGATATLMPSGRVLVTGGAEAGFWIPLRPTATHDTALVFDPETGTWLRTAAMVSPRYDHAAALLGDGRVFITGGESNDELSPDNTYTLMSTELYAPGGPPEPRRPSGRLSPQLGERMIRESNRRTP